MSIDWEMDKQTAAYSNGGRQINNEKKGATDTPNSMDGPQNHYAKRKEPESPQPKQKGKKENTYCRSLLI